MKRLQSATLPLLIVLIVLAGLQFVVDRQHRAQQSADMAAMDAQIKALEAELGRLTTTVDGKQKSAAKASDASRL